MASRGPIHRFEVFVLGVTSTGDWLGTQHGVSSSCCCCTLVLGCSVCEKAGPVVRPFSFFAALRGLLPRAVRRSSNSTGKIRLRHASAPRCLIRMTLAGHEGTFLTAIATLLQKRIVSGWRSEIHSPTPKHDCPKPRLRRDAVRRFAEQRSCINSHEKTTCTHIRLQVAADRIVVQPAVALVSIISRRGRFDSSRVYQPAGWLPELA